MMTPVTYKRLSNHGWFESVGDIINRMRLGAESQMGAAFDHRLSLRLDQLVELGECLNEMREETR